MKTAKLKRLISIEVDLETYWPDDLECFGLWLDAEIGLSDTAGADIFRIFICTPDWLKKRLPSEKIMLGRYLMIVSEYDLDAIIIFINQYIEKCDGEDWVSIANKLSRVWQWEFEDYKP